MANRKLTELPILSTINLDSTDLLYIVDTETDTSRSIPYSFLAGDSFNSLSAYTFQNTLNINFLSGGIDDNTSAINSLIIDEGSLGFDVQYLSGSIDINTSLINQLSTEFDNSDIGDLATDILAVSGTVDELSANQIVLGEDVDVVYTSLSGLTGYDFQNTLNLNFLSGAIDLNTSYVDQVSVIPTTTNTLTATHFVTVNIGGNDYKLLLSDMT